MRVARVGVRAVAVGLALAGAAVAAGAGPAVPRGLAEEALGWLRDYLRIDTSNPPGNEAKASSFLAGILAREGIEHVVLPVAPGRVNLVARVPGDGSRRPLALLHHMDVVPAEPKHWSVDPFGGEVSDGYLYGRGAVDIKGKGILDLAILVAVRRLGLRLGRDLILVAVADEEVNSIGARWMVREGRRHLRDAEFLIDEGASIRARDDGRTDAWMVSVGEKSPLWLELSYRGEPGHGSLPRRDTSVARAVKAAARVFETSPAWRALPAVRGQLARMCRDLDLTRAPGWRGSFEASLDDPRFLTHLALDPERAALLGDTVGVTRLGGSDKINTIPNEAMVGLDCRLLPGTTREAFLAELGRRIGDLGDSMRVVEGYEAGPPSPVETPLMAAIRAVAARRDPGVPVVPVLLTASTDAWLFRSLGMVVYGFEPYRLAAGDLERAHGNDERLPVAEIGRGLGVMLDLVQALDLPAAGGPGVVAATEAEPRALGDGEPTRLPVLAPPPRPASWVRGVPDVSQMNSWTCGASAVEAVLQAFGFEGYQEAYAREMESSEDQGTHPGRMVEALRRRGLRATLVEGMTLDGLRGQVDAGNLVIVAYQAWGGQAGKPYREEWEDGHYSVVVGYGDGFVFLEDPSILGSLGIIPEREFEERWHDYEVEEGGRREYHRMGIVVPGPVPVRARYEKIE